MYLRAEITTSCKSENTRYTRLNLLGWAALCPRAAELLWHDSTPLSHPGYPTAEESKDVHDSLVELISTNINKITKKNQLVDYKREYEHFIGLIKDGVLLCARSKADLVYTLNLEGSLFTLYVEASSSRINVAKPWQALLRGIALYYERRIPVGIIIVSPEKIMYKLLEDRDQEEVLKRLFRSAEGFKPSPNLCSLCELSHYCRYKVI